MMNVQELTKKRFGRLTVLGVIGGGRVVAICECGFEKIFQLGHLVSGSTKSCGCLKREYATRLAPKAIAAKTTHGEARKGRTPEYRSWRNMITRCTNAKHKFWHRYGGRGITVCAEWLSSYELFLAHVGRRPSPTHSLDRFPNNDGNYEPGNVRWATKKEQVANR